MNESQISVRYARALFQSASEKQVLDIVYNDMEVLSETCKLEDFHYMLVLPSLKVSQKSNFVKAVFENHLSEISISMIKLVIKNKREIYLPGIARNFREFYRKSKNIRTAALVTAQPVNDSAMKSIKELIKKDDKSEVDLTATVDEEIIGGFVLTIEDLRYDASVASDLRKIKKQLLKTTIEKN